MHVHVAKDAKQGDPQDEKDQVPSPDEPEPQNKRDQVEYGCECGQAADNLGVHPFRVLVFALLGGAMQVDAVEPADGDGEGKLHDVNGGEDHVGYGHAKETHLEVMIVEVCSSSSPLVGFGVCVFVCGCSLVGSTWVFSRMIYPQEQAGREENDFVVRGQKEVSLLA